MEKIINTVLVALMPSLSDFEIAKTNHWYRIPVKSAPPIVKNNDIEYITFYHPRLFEKEQYSIKYYARVRNVSKVKRKELFPNEIHDLRAEDIYYKIEFDPLLILPSPIISLRHRRLLFIPTTQRKLFNPIEINQLFSDSPLEESLWTEFVGMNIKAERQFFITILNKSFFLDFAIFCKTRNINIECDGDKFHTKKVNVQSDKRRNNLLESLGWSVLRFTTSDLLYEMDSTKQIISKSINKYGGVEEIGSLDEFRYVKDISNNQLLLFD